MTKRDLTQLAADLTRRLEPFVQAVVVARRAPSSAQVGDRAIVTAGGEFHGWLGGSCTRPTVVAEARRALADGRPRLVALSPDPEAQSELGRRPGLTVFPMTCHSGGSVEIYLEPVLPSPSLAVFGASPAARALVRLGKVLGYRVAVADPDAEADGFPEADLVAADLAGADLRAFAHGRRPFAVVATLGEDDEGAIRAALALDPAYLGVVASARRFAQVRENLLAGGVAAADLDRIHSPAGLDFGARAPEEIALSILAEIVQVRRAADADGVAADGVAAEPQAATESQAAAPAPLQAKDPICGMTVEIAGARHTAEHAGATFYFCCGGCRERFLGDPARYAGGAA
jgi:xanthine dehydrogenase accessory factor